MRRVRVVASCGMAKSSMSRRSPLTGRNQRGILSIEVTASQTKNVSINVLDLPGSVITSISDASFNGLKRYEIDLSKLSAGIYFIKVDAGDFRSTQRINVIR